MDYQIDIRAGRLTIRTRREDLPLGELLDFASRQNPRRGFLFVSRVLGKHIPVRPARMRQIYDRLAERIDWLPGPVVVMGMAETATGLAGGVADSLQRLSPDRESIYLHTTRHHLDRELLACFDEHHSHAPDHLIYRPDPRLEPLFRRAASLVLVDDEISTGRTLAGLARGLAGSMPQLQQLVLVSIVDWLSHQRRAELIGSLAPSCPAPGFTSLLEGDFDFTPDANHRPKLPLTVAARRRSGFTRPDTGRLGLRLPRELDESCLAGLPDGPLVVVGTGEYTFEPFLLAERLEALGRDVLFQSTTRSPILPGEAIASRRVFPDDHGEGVTNYLYNLPPERTPVVVYEHPAMVEGHPLPGLIGGVAWTLPPGK
ncbi:MAG: phosphoribosyltransferase domain-containing protein [Candidatus Competibacteraceae bacterium]|nr:phosphoribosyltransferase domain-containing protein [Candidatus Competibacteraceae bacterium]